MAKGSNSSSMSQAVQDPEQQNPDRGPADAFRVLGNEHRLEILRALWATEDEPVNFSNLFDAVSIDDSGQFNYHLEQLTTQFVDHTGEGYELRRAGEKVLQAILAGSFTPHDRRELQTGDQCLRCGELLIAEYRDETMSIRCGSCGFCYGEYPFPPGGLNDRSDEEILRAFDQRVRHLHCLAADGVCHECNGKMESRIVEEGECCLAGSIRLEHECQQCNHTLCASLGLGLLDNSTVVSFYRDNGIDLSQTPYWELPWCVSDEPIEVRTRDPWVIDVRLKAGESERVITIDETLTQIA